MGLRFKLQLVAIGDDDEQVSIDDLVVLTKATSGWSRWA